MTILGRRVRKLEDQLGADGNQTELVMVVSRIGRDIALDQESCVAILRQSGFLPRRGFGLVDLGKLPLGLDAAETRSFLQNHGSEICAPRIVQSASRTPAHQGLRR